MGCSKGKYIRVDPECPYERDIKVPRRTDLVLSSQAINPSDAPFNYDDGVLTFRIYDGEHSDTVIAEINDATFTKQQSDEAVAAGIAYNDVWTLVVKWDNELALLDEYEKYWYSVSWDNTDPDIEMTLWRGGLEKDYK